MSIFDDLEAIYEKLKEMEETRIDIILLTTASFDGVMRTNHKGQWYAIMNKGIFEKEVKPELVKANLPEPMGDKPAYISMPLTPIPVIEDNDLALEIATSKLDEAYRNIVSDLFEPIGYKFNGMLKLPGEREV